MSDAPVTLYISLKFSRLTSHCASIEAHRSLAARMHRSQLECRWKFAKRSAIPL